MAEYSDPTDLPDHVDVVGADQDLDGNGVLDTVVVHPGSPLASVLHELFEDASVAVVSDFDGDGYADHITAFEDDGGYSSWQLASGDETSWNLSDRGTL